MTTQIKFLYNKYINRYKFGIGFVSNDGSGDGNTKNIHPSRIKINF